MDAPKRPLDAQTSHPGFGTLAVHGGQSPDPLTGAVTAPIYQTSTYRQPALGHHLGWEYSRGANPTREALERNVAALEGGRHALAFSSGVAAIEGVLKTLSTGDHIVCEEGAYGGTRRLLLQVVSRWGIGVTFADSRDLNRLAEAVRPETRLLLMETPTNPMLRLCDLRAVAEIARGAGARLFVDNTFATPFNQRPLELGADIVGHSTTKYLNGHADLVGGALVTSDDAIAEELRALRNSTGAVPSAMDAWLVLRGAKTLHLRMRAHNANAMAVAHYLEGHAGIERVHYPGLPSHPQHELARRQMAGFSGMVTVDMGTRERARRFVEGTHLFALAESLGGVESLVAVPSMMSHSGVPPAERAALGITDGTVRLSCGIEEEADLLADLEEALKGV